MVKVMAKTEVNPNRKEELYRLFEEGKTPTDPEVKALGYKAGTVHKEYSMWRSSKATGKAVSKCEEKAETAGGEEGEKEEPKREGIADEFVEGEAIWIKAQVSMKTMTYYELAKSRVAREDGSKLSLGDFLDICVDDYFKGRGQELGIIRL